MPAILLVTVRESLVSALSDLEPGPSGPFSYLVFASQLDRMRGGHVW